VVSLKQSLAQNDIVLQNLGLSYGHAKPVFKNLNITFKKHSFTALMGPSGCGKSSLLKVIAGLQKQTEGHLTLPEDSSAIVFQDARLLPWLNVEQNIMLPLKLGAQKSPIDFKVDLNKLIQKLNLAGAETLYPHQLSGGMKQRVALARSLILKPTLLLLDEPFSSLDEILKIELEDLMLQLWRETAMTVILVTHSISEAAKLAQNCILLKKHVSGIYAEINCTDKEEAIALMRTQLKGAYQ
jgi:NitT/TauT family transport system ATP-binding protein